MVATTTSVICDGFAHMMVGGQHATNEMYDTLADIINLVSCHDDNVQVVKKLSEDFVNMHLNSGFRQISNSLRLILSSFE